MTHATEAIARLVATDLCADLHITVPRERPPRTITPDEIEGAALLEMGGRGSLLLRAHPWRNGAGPGERIELEVAEGTLLELRHLTGTVTIGDTRGRLALDVRDGASVRVGAVGAAEITAQGNSRVTVGEVRDRLRVDASERARVRVAGTLDSLDVRVTGTGDVDFNGVADHANLSVYGTGHISVLRVRETLRRLCVGSGDISVSKPPPVVRG